MHGSSAALVPLAPPLSRHREANVFWRLRGLIVSTTLRRMFQTARLRVTLVVLLSAIFWAGLFVLFLEGFSFLASIHTDFVPSLYNIFFASLMVMLLFSAGILLYGGLFRSPETAFLLTTPARTERVFLHKFQDSIWFSSWGCILLGTPMLVAYGVVAGAPWHYFALILPFMLAFVFTPASLGAIACLVIVSCVPRLRRHLLLAAGGVVLLGIVWAGLSLSRKAEGDLLTQSWFDEIKSRLEFADQRLLPSWWLSSGLLEASRQAEPDVAEHQPWAHSILFLAVLVSNAMFWQLVAVWTSGKLLRTAYSRMASSMAARRRVRPALIDRAMLAATFFLPRHIRLLLVKDLRMFRRDPVQWSQFLIFFGLLGLYFVNIRQLNYDVGWRSYVNAIGFLNLAVIGLILSTFTTRFIFPLVSLEGRQLWILGLLPVKRGTILWGKFLFAGLGTTVPCVLLILLSDLMLRLPPAIVLTHQAICVMLCLGLSGIAVGLGAKMPDLRQSCPSKIAAGFGGTLNLVLSAMYIILIVGASAVPAHFYVDLPTAQRFWILMGCLGGSAFLATLATAGSLWLGLRAFEDLEF